ncbi:MAG: hypothetical protein K9M15_02505 [Candidatus Marinimicrobia bacterium]|nr:hypothetical protein [Candidatus Neomarinimicrobiota bacterium]
MRHITVGAVKVEVARLVQSSGNPVELDDLVKALSKRFQTIEECAKISVLFAEHCGAITIEKTLF